MSEFISILKKIRPGYKPGGLVEKGTELYGKYPPDRDWETKSAVAARL